MACSCFKDVHVYERNMRHFNIVSVFETQWDIKHEKLHPLSRFWITAYNGVFFWYFAPLISQLPLQVRNIVIIPRLPGANRLPSSIVPLRSVDNGDLLDANNVWRERVPYVYYFTESLQLFFCNSSLWRCIISINAVEHFWRATKGTHFVVFAPVSLCVFSSLAEP